MTGFTCQNGRGGGLALPLVLDIRRIRNDHDAVRAGLARRGDEAVLDELERVRGLDETARRVVAERDELRARIKSLSAEVGALRRDGKAEDAEALQAESRDLGLQEKDLDAEADRLATEVRDLLLAIPNIPADDAPDGASEQSGCFVQMSLASAGACTMNSKATF